MLSKSILSLSLKKRLSSSSSSISIINRSLSTSSYRVKQERLGRPLSPDLEIYKLPYGAVSSIIVGRITGVAMWGGLAMISVGQIYGVDWLHVMQGMSACTYSPFIKLAVATPLSYHYIGAVRHAVKLFYTIYYYLLYMFLI